MAYKVEVQPLAESDAYTAYEYLRKFSPQYAETWLSGIFLAFQTLEEMPARCPLIAEAEEIGYSARQLLYGKRPNIYRIIFDVQEFAGQEPIVRILRIWHGARDVISLQDLEE